MAGEDNKAQGAMDKLKGKAQETMGKVTGDEEQEAKGKGTQAGGEVRQGVGNIQDAAHDLTRDK
ncbi:MAG: hypothetical protein NVS2B16_06860 [Chloroflexota bacterium]